MHISLPENLTNYIQSKMASGLYRDATEVISEALRQKILLEENNTATEELRREIMLGWDEAERGECSPFDLAALKKDLDTGYHG